jgi:hypothetical protein
MSTQKVDSLRCSACKAQLKAVTHQLIDGQDLVMKSAFLQKRVHRVLCPQCNAVLIAAVPTLYYDAEQQRALVFAPADLHLSVPTQATATATLLDMLRAVVPPDQQTDALLNPRRVASLDALVDAVLLADGLDPAQIKTQAAKAKLIETLVQAPSEAALKELATTHAADLDATFFELLTAYMQTAHFKGDALGAQTFLSLRTLLGQWVPDGKRTIAAIDAKLGVVAIQSREELLERLRRAQTDAERAELVATGHVLLDQTFFQLLNDAVEQARNAGDTTAVTQLKSLSAALYELKAEQAAKSQAALQKAAALFQAVVQADAPDKVLKQRINDVDESFFVVLGANIERARRQGQHEPVRALELIGQLARTLRQEQVA